MSAGQLNSTREAGVLTCVDSVVRDRELWDFNNRFGKGRWWWVQSTGGVKKLLYSDEKNREQILESIRELDGIAPFGLIILVNYSHCIAYKLAGHEFANPREEETFHTEEMKKAKTIIEKEFPDKKVEVHYFLKEENRLAW